MTISVSRSRPVACPVIRANKSARRHRAPRIRTCVRSSVGPGSAFDESPAEPVSQEEKQISASLMDSMRDKIATALGTDQVTVKDVYGNSQHVSIEVISSVFEDKTSVQRQRMVYKVRRA